MTSAASPQRYRLRLRRLVWIPRGEGRRTSLHRRGYLRRYGGIGAGALRRRQNARFEVGDEPSQPADYSVASGIFNVRLSNSTEEWERHIEQAIEVLDRSSTRGFAFNCLTAYSDEDKQRDCTTPAPRCCSVSASASICATWRCCTITICTNSRYWSASSAGRRITSGVFHAHKIGCIRFR